MRSNRIVFATLVIISAMSLAAHANTRYQCLPKSLHFQMTKENSQYKNYFSLDGAIQDSHGNILNIEPVFTPDKKNMVIEPVKSLATWASASLPEISHFTGIWLLNNKIICNYDLKDFIIVQEESPIKMQQMISIASTNAVPENCKLQGGQVSNKGTYCRGKKCNVICSEKAVIQPKS